MARGQDTGHSPRRQVGPTLRESGQDFHSNFRDMNVGEKAYFGALSPAIVGFDYVASKVSASRTPKGRGDREFNRASSDWDKWNDQTPYPGDTKGRMF